VQLFSSLCGKDIAQQASNIHPDADRRHFSGVLQYGPPIAILFDMDRDDDRFEADKQCCNKQM